jgi:hypothetical protein
MLCTVILEQWQQSSPNVLLLLDFRPCCQIADNAYQSYNDAARVIPVYYYTFDSWVHDENHRYTFHHLYIYMQQCKRRTTRHQSIPCIPSFFLYTRTHKESILKTTASHTHIKFHASYSTKLNSIPTKNSFLQVPLCLHALLEISESETLTGSESPLL